ncbi:HD domain-containing protein [Rufibacter latericius]|uniref:HD domain-containing protein n=1 Tax=Rufibacter latericius TaxID=2487040 RepID=A0A3M9MBL6_9BACT|nr:HD domain-containing protein [Rufibacter latericius]RNI21978.1 HD domain-containing protein [Rufibacter latericius]
MAHTSFPEIQQHVEHKLRNGLSPHLTYHCLAHTLDVLRCSETIALAEKIRSPQDLLLLKVAVLYHDCGFLETYQDHERKGCDIARCELPGFGFNPEETEVICRLIMATKLPQSPRTMLEQVICDADLDYLGREDYSPIAHRLYLEMQAMGLLETEEEWRQVQIKFLEKHRYFTRYSRLHREAGKQANLQALKVSTNQLLRKGA